MAGGGGVTRVGEVGGGGWGVGGCGRGWWVGGGGGGGGRGGGGDMLFGVTRWNHACVTLNDFEIRSFVQRT